MTLWKHEIKLSSKWSSEKQNLERVDKYLGSRLASAGRLDVIQDAMLVQSVLVGKFTFLYKMQGKAK